MTTTAISRSQTNHSSSLQAQGIHQFTLVPNIEKTGALRIIWLILGVCFPLVLTHLLFLEAFELGWSEYALAQIPVLIILLNFYYFFMHRAKTPQSLQLWIEMDELCLKSSNKVLHRQKIETLSFQQLGWGMDSCDLLPALRIKGPEFPTLLIGTTNSPIRWTNVRQSVEFTDYWLHPHDSWDKLKALLAV